jgi:hypothetical protein
MRFAWAACISLTVIAARASDSTTDAATSYAVHTAGSTTALAVGEAGRLVLEIQPKAGIRVQRQAALRLKLVSSPGLGLAKERLEREHLMDGSAEAPRFEVPFVARTAGSQELAATLDFFVCSERWCVRQQPSVKLLVEVR